MKNGVSPFLYWAPRILSIAFVAFLFLFSLDIFDMGLDLWGTLLGLFMHNIPALILLAIAIVSWKHELVGAVVFALFGLGYVVIVATHVPWYMAVSWSMTVSGPAFLTGFLFFLNWRKKKAITASFSSSATEDTNTRSGG